MRRTFVWIVAAAVIVPGSAGPASAGDAAPDRPKLNLRAAPRMGFPPADVLVVVELKGGTPSEEYYCPRLEWDWGDGSRSVEESDCPPFESAESFERFFSARHLYRAAGTYDVRVSLQRADRTLAVGSVAVVLHGSTVPRD